jgi:hypothetical protein
MKLPTLIFLALTVAGLSAQARMNPKLPVPRQRQVQSAPAVQPFQRLHGPVRVSIVLLSGPGAPFQFPLLRPHPGRTSTVQVAGDRYSITTAPVAKKDAIAVTVKHSVLHPPTKQFRLVSAQTVTVAPNHPAKLRAGGDEYRVATNVAAQPNRTRYARAQ